MSHPSWADMCVSVVGHGGGKPLWDSRKTKLIKEFLESRGISAFWKAQGSESSEAFVTGQGKLYPCLSPSISVAVFMSVCLGLHLSLYLSTHLPYDQLKKKTM